MGHPALCCFRNEFLSTAFFFEAAAVGEELGGNLITIETFPDQIDTCVLLRLKMKGFLLQMFIGK